MQEQTTRGSCRKQNNIYLCNRNGQAPLTHGVMVAQQILVLFVKVRILVSQHEQGAHLPLEKMGALRLLAYVPQK